MAHRDERGRFLPGHGESKGFGRPMEKYKRSVQEAIAQRFPPETIVDMLEESLDIARSKGSPKGILNVVVEILDRTVGPAVRVDTPPESDAMMEMIEQWRIAKLKILEEPSKIVEDSTQ